jgi:hypothetical protein
VSTRIEVRRHQWPPQSTDPPTRPPTPSPIAEAGRERWKGLAGHRHVRSCRLGHQIHSPRGHSRRQPQLRSLLDCSIPPPRQEPRRGATHRQPPARGYRPGVRPGSSITGARPALLPSGRMAAQIHGHLLACDARGENSPPPRPRSLPRRARRWQRGRGWGERGTRAAARVFVRAAQGGGDAGALKNS